ncbi:hypothetical protein BDF14DRAFT_1960819 [Spinellus fusiger]|nr:hypothetical protein BDF14DRAFT_1960819 [Spinellus fusiger]
MESHHSRLQHILSSPQLLSSFESYLQSIEAHENLLFIEAISQLRHEQHPDNLESIVHRIWRTFIDLGAPLELDVKSAKQVGQAIKSMKWAIFSKEKAISIFSSTEKEVRAFLESKIADFDKVCKQEDTSSIANCYQKKVVIVGGGFTGFTVASILDHMPRFHVTLIDTKDSFEYSPGIIKMLVRPEETSSLRVRHDTYVKHGRVVIGCAERIENDATAILVNDELITFDYLVIATGSSYKSKLKSFDISSLYRLSELSVENEQLKKSESILIIGGGLVGCELASEIAQYDFPSPYKKKKRITLVESHSDLVYRSSTKRREKAVDYLTRLGVEVVCGERIVDFDSSEKNTYMGSSGRAYRNYDKVYLATGTTPCSNLLQGDGDVGFETCIDLWDRIRVKPTLQLDHWKYQHIFSGGDVTNVEEEKTGFSATLAGVCIARNICRIEKGKPPLRQGDKRSMAAPNKPLHGISANGGIGRQNTSTIKRTFAFLNPTWAALKNFDEQQFLKIVQGEAAACSLAVGRKPKKLDVVKQPISRTGSFSSNSQPPSIITLNSQTSSESSTQSSEDGQSLRSYLYSPELFDLNIAFEKFTEPKKITVNDDGNISQNMNGHKKSHSYSISLYSHSKSSQTTQSAKMSSMTKSILSNKKSLFCYK